jgi:hypothetical protein
MPPFMLSMPLKWLLIGLMVVSFVGRPWAQALATSPAHGCGSAAAVAMQSGQVAGAQEQPGEIAAVAIDDPAKAMTAACVKTCAAAPIFIQLSVIWSPEIWPQIHTAAVSETLRGHPLKPELAPPIALI